jgi:hypothetical protein
LKLDDLSNAALERFVVVCKELLEEAFARSMPYEEINTRLKEFTMIQEVLHRRNQKMQEERDEEGARSAP